MQELYCLEGTKMRAGTIRRPVNTIGKTRNKILGKDIRVKIQKQLLEKKRTKTHRHSKKWKPFGL